MNVSNENQMSSVIQEVISEELPRREFLQVLSNQLVKRQKETRRWKYILTFASSLAALALAFLLFLTFQAEDVTRNSSIDYHLEEYKLTSVHDTMKVISQHPEIINFEGNDELLSDISTILSHLYYLSNEFSTMNVDFINLNESTLTLNFNELGTNSGQVAQLVIDAKRGVIDSFSLSYKYKPSFYFKNEITKELALKRGKEALNLFFSEKMDKGMEEIVNSREAIVTFGNVKIGVDSNGDIISLSQ
ncbi:hypothetical protein [Bacillus sp. AK128]